MTVKRIYAVDMHRALDNIRNRVAADAAIMASRQVAGGVAVSADVGCADRVKRAEFIRLSKTGAVADRFLDISLQYAGEDLFDESVRKAIEKQNAAIDASPGSNSSLAYEILAKAVSEWSILDQSRGRLAFFVERLSS